MRRILCIMFLALMTALPSMAQQSNNGDRRHFNPEEFRTMMRNYIRDKAGLTQQEADKLFPIYFEMKTKQMELNGKMMKLKREAPNCNAGSKEYSEIISKITGLNVDLAKLEQTYYAKMCKAVDAKKVYSVMSAEEAFHREMLWRATPRAGKPWNQGGNGGNRDQHQRGWERRDGNK